MTSETQAPTGLARRGRRLSDRETEQRMLRAAVAMVQRTGLTVSLDHISFEDVIRDADGPRPVTRTSAAQAGTVSQQTVTGTSRVFTAVVVSRCSRRIPAAPRAIRPWRGSAPSGRPAATPGLL